MSDHNVKKYFLFGTLFFFFLCFPYRLFSDESAVEWEFISPNGENKLCRRDLAVIDRHVFYANGFEENELFSLEIDVRGSRSKMVWKLCCRDKNHGWPLCALLYLSFRKSNFT
ncbi:MAG: hypothetical protein LBJ31_10685 [Treponema sp.]|nr:hypothetical protein [Treponema sp.]